MGFTVKLLQYGACVLLDTTWAAARLLSSSRSFKSVLCALSSGLINGSDVNSKDVIASLSVNARSCLRSILFSMGGLLMREYYDAFVNNYPCPVM